MAVAALYCEHVVVVASVSHRPPYPRSGCVLRERVSAVGSLAYFGVFLWHHVASYWVRFNVRIVVRPVYESPSLSRSYRFRLGYLHHRGSGYILGVLVYQRISHIADFLPSVEVSSRDVCIWPEIRFYLPPESVQSVHRQLELKSLLRFPVHVHDVVIVVLVLRFVEQIAVIELPQVGVSPVKRKLDHDVQLWFGVLDIRPLVRWMNVV